MDPDSAIAVGEQKRATRAACFSCSSFAASWRPPTPSQPRDLSSGALLRTAAALSASTTSESSRLTIASTRVLARSQQAPGTAGA
jgi:hypothetical protein